jgi:hypothetical protein
MIRQIPAVRSPTRLLETANQPSGSELRTVAVLDVKKAIRPQSSFWMPHH